MRRNILRDKSFKFAIRIVNLYKFLLKEENEFVLSKQILRSGTSIGAMIRESEYAQTQADFIHKLSIGIKEANETNYWLDLLYETKYIEQKLYQSINNDCIELLKLLIASIKTAKKNNE